MRAGSFKELGVVMRPGMEIKRRKTQIELPKDNRGGHDLLASGALAIKVRLNRFQLRASIGVYDHEKDDLRPLIINIEVGIKPNTKVNDDLLSNTIDYDFLAQVAKELAASKHFNLVETFAQEYSEILIEQEKIHSIELEIEKPDSVSGSLSSSVTLKWIRN